MCLIKFEWEYGCEKWNIPALFRPLLRYETFCELSDQSMDSMTKQKESDIHVCSNVIHSILLLARVLKQAGLQGSFQTFVQNIDMSRRFNKKF